MPDVASDSALTLLISSAPEQKKPLNCQAEKVQLLFTCAKTINSVLLSWSQDYSFGISGKDLTQKPLS